WSSDVCSSDLLDLSPFRDPRIIAVENEQITGIRMFLGKAIGKAGAPAGTWIRNAIRKEQDDRVRISLLQGCTSLPLNIRHGIWAASLRDKNELVAQTAAD